MAAPFFTTPFQPYVYQGPQDAVIPFQILGEEAQIVQIMLKSQEKVTARPGSMCYTSGSIQMENVYLPEQEVGVWQWLFGKTVTSIVFLNSGSSDGYVGITAPTLARILPIDLATFGGELLCQPDAFLCSVNDVKADFLVCFYYSRDCCDKSYLVRGLPLLLEVDQKNLEVGEAVAVDESCIIALTTTVNVQVKYNTPIRRAVFGGDNQVTAVLTGPGIVFIQSLPFQKLSQCVARAVTSPNMRENPKFFAQIALFFLLAYIVILSSLILTDV